MARVPFAGGAAGIDVDSCTDIADMVEHQL